MLIEELARTCTILAQELEYTSNRHQITTQQFQRPQTTHLPIHDKQLSISGIFAYLNSVTRTPSYPTIMRKTTSLCFVSVDTKQ